MNDSLTHRCVAPDADRDQQGSLLYPERRFAVWRDADGIGQPYLVDQHSYPRLTEALDVASSWIQQQAGSSSAVVYQRETGRILALYTQTPQGQRGCLLSSPDGQHHVAVHPSLCENVRWAQQHPVTSVSFRPIESSLSLQWYHYQTARNRLAHDLRSRGQAVSTSDHLADLLSLYQLRLLNTHREEPEEAMGEVVFDPACAYYDAHRVQEVLFALAPCFTYPSYVEAVVGGKRVRWKMRENRFSLGGWAIASTDLSDRQRQRADVARPVLSLDHPDGQHLPIVSADELRSVALDILLYRLVFEDVLNAGDARHTFLARTLDSVVPGPLDLDGLRACMELVPDCFTTEWTIPQTKVLSAADLVSTSLRAWIELLYLDCWEEVLTRARHVTFRNH